MIHDPASQAQTSQPQTWGRSATRSGGWAGAVVAVSASGVLASLLVWAMRGWADALAAYVLTIGAVAALLLWQTGMRPNAAPGDPAAAALKNVGPGLALRSGLSIATDAQSGLNRLHG